MLRDLLGGRKSVAATYWLGHVAVATLMMFVMRGLTWVYLSSDDAIMAALYEKLDLVLRFLWIAYMAFIVRAIYRASYWQRSPGFWSWLGIGIVSFVIAAQTYTIVLVLFPNLPVSEIALRADVKELNKSLPVDMGDGMSLRRASLKDGDMTYHFTWDIALTTEDILDVRQSIEADLRRDRELCTDMEGAFKGPLERIVYQYDIAGGLEFESALTKADCRELMGEDW